MAKERNLDLVEVAGKAKPPVCRIMDYGKYLYQQTKKFKQTKQKSKLKEVRLRLKTAPHDLEIKIKQIEKFFKKGYKVRVSLMLKGREKAHHDLAKEKMYEFIKLLGQDIEIEREIKKTPQGLDIIINKNG